MLFNSPLSDEKSNRLIEVLELSDADRAIDVGCGMGEFLVRLVAASGCSALGIDINTTLIEAASAKASTRLSNGSIEFRAADINGESLDDDSYDLAICMGSTHAFGRGEVAYPRALDELARIVRPGGQLLIGEGYWKQPPAQEYLEFLGDPTGIYHTHAENIWFAERRGLMPLYAIVSNDDEWDHFEGSHWMKAERANEGDEEKLRKSRAWRDGYLRWGRETMGFGFYLFRV